MTYRSDKKEKRGEIRAHLDFLAEIYGAKRKTKGEQMGANLCPFSATDFSQGCDCPEHGSGGRRCRYRSSEDGELGLSM
jgi:hypothetical protein